MYPLADRADQSAVYQDLEVLAPQHLSALSEHVILMLTALANHDYVTYMESLQVGKRALALAQVLGAPHDVAAHVYRAGLLHYIGRVNIPRSLLSGGCDSASWTAELQRCQATFGAAIVTSFADTVSLAPIIMLSHAFRAPQPELAGHTHDRTFQIAVLVAIAASAPSYERARTMIYGCQTRRDSFISTRYLVGRQETAQPS